MIDMVGDRCGRACTDRLPVGDGLDWAVPQLAAHLEVLLGIHGSGGLVLDESSNSDFAEKFPECEDYAEEEEGQKPSTTRKKGLAHCTASHR